ncbi:MAG: hypothetical protein IJ767_00335 [Bacteroidaceae bacterium]|nr:hypothetical protein [Bacteroidaceae bacterium]
MLIAITSRASRTTLTSFPNLPGKVLPNSSRCVRQKVACCCRYSNYNYNNSPLQL